MQYIIIFILNCNELHHKTTAYSILETYLQLEQSISALSYNVDVQQQKTEDKNPHLISKIKVFSLNKECLHFCSYSVTTVNC